jgi:hypothetical protein
MRSFLRSIRLVGALTLVLAGLAGCKQGEGERCQIDSDCEEGLICSTSNSTCVPKGVTTDAGPTIDAPPATTPDAGIPDAGAPDATPATPDAADLPDAA